MKGAYLHSMAMAFVGFSLWTSCDAVIRYLRDYPPVVLSFLTAVVSLGVVLALSPWLGGLRETLRKPQMGLQWLRGLVLAVPGLLTYVAFAHLEMPTAYAIIFMTPFMNKILSVFLMKERVRPISWLITLIGFVGVLIVLRPGYIPLNIGSISAVALTGFWALGYALSRYIGEKNQTLISHSLFIDFFLVVFLAVPAFLMFEDLPPFAWLLIVYMGVISFIGNVMVSLAFARAPSAYIAPIHYVQILWGILFGAVLFGEYPDKGVLLGSAVIIGAGMMLIFRGKNAHNLP